MAQHLLSTKSSDVPVLSSKSSCVVLIVYTGVLECSLLDLIRIKLNAGKSLLSALIKHEAGAW